MSIKLKLILNVILLLLLQYVIYGATIAGEAVITKTSVNSFDEAKSKSVKSVKDGEPVYLWLKLPNPIEQYVQRWETNSNILNSDKKVLLIEVGPKGDLNTTYNYGYILPKESELKQNVLSVNLAPGEIGPMWIGVWLKTVGGGSPGLWDNEIRIYQLGPPSKPDRKLLAKVPLTANVDNGIDKYREMMNEYQKKYESGDPSINEIPPKGKLGDKEAAVKIIARSGDSIGQKIEGFYFTDNVWYEHRDKFDKLEKHSTYGSVFYKMNGKYYVRFIEIFRLLNGQIDIILNSELELTKENYNKGISLSK